MIVFFCFFIKKFDKNIKCIIIILMRCIFISALLLDNIFFTEVKNIR